ncbi:hypothetical protein LOAG_14792 [Loa loa]|uniref:Uncharacterized protein n=1 Tax=Loa loa TaxID=7209 RepID=A0A1S0TH16_LOALO|nr:hypothetical protein LOAG_14792 [Loa loa]EFO13735.1 hypothetical protein LOAG_14792 [Loa loa]
MSVELIFGILSNRKKYHRLFICYAKRFGMKERHLFLITDIVSVSYEVEILMSSSKVIPSRHRIVRGDKRNRKDIMDMFHVAIVTLHKIVSHLHSYSMIVALFV